MDKSRDKSSGKGEEYAQRQSCEKENGHCLSSMPVCGM